MLKKECTKLSTCSEKLQVYNAEKNSQVYHVFAENIMAGSLFSSNELFLISLMHFQWKLPSVYVNYPDNSVNSNSQVMWTHTHFLWRDLSLKSGRKYNEVTARRGSTVWPFKVILHYLSFQSSLPHNDSVNYNQPIKLGGGGGGEEKSFSIKTVKSQGPWPRFWMGLKCDFYLEIILLRGEYTWIYWNRKRFKKEIKEKKIDLKHHQTVRYPRKGNMGWYQLFGCPSINY